ncbi:hypothetical protein EEB14_53800 [Rhodococcus sp. WS4]|nr:hypothetical protein EEB14_53800 [Rhodococcus sp. WS4]
MITRTLPTGPIRGASIGTEEIKARINAMFLDEPGRDDRHVPPPGRRAGMKLTPLLMVLAVAIGAVAAVLSAGRRDITV